MPHEQNNITIRTYATSYRTSLSLYGGAENAGVENAGVITYGKPSEDHTLHNT